MTTETAPDGTQKRVSRDGRARGRNGRHAMSNRARKTTVNTPDVVAVVETPDVVAVVEPAIAADDATACNGMGVDACADCATAAIDACTMVVAPVVTTAITVAMADNDGLFNVVVPPHAVAIARAFRAVDAGSMLACNGGSDAARDARHAMASTFHASIIAAHVPGANMSPAPFSGITGANVTRTQNDIACAFAIAFPGADPVNASGIIAAMWHAIIGRHHADYAGSKWHYGGSTSRDFLNDKHDVATFAMGRRMARALRFHGARPAIIA